MRTYPKIETVFNRGADFKVINELRRPEFGLIKEWIFTEKVDGTNVRIDYRWSGLESPVDWVIGGRTDASQMPTSLISVLTKQIEATLGQVQWILGSFDLTSMTLFGEGYGPKIQKGGGLYSTDQNFILFDVLVDDKAWLDEDGVTITAQTLGIDRVPTLYTGTIDDVMTALASNSIVSMTKGHETEGVVARTKVPLFNSRGDRVMWKLKGRDYKGGQR